MLTEHCSGLIDMSERYSVFTRDATREKSEGGIFPNIGHSAAGDSVVKRAVGENFLGLAFYFQILSSEWLFSYNLSQATIFYQ